MKTSEILQSVLAVGKYLESNPQKPITNGDRIRGMGDIELANFLSGLTMCGCVNCPMYYPEENDECVKNCNPSWQNWVEQESEGE